MTYALPCQIAQAAQFPNQTVCPNNPTGLARPWRAWLRTDYSSCSWEFATRDEAVAYLRDQLQRRPLDTQVRYKAGRDRNQYHGTFVQHGLEAYSLADLGLAPLYTVEMPPAPEAEWTPQRVFSVGCRVRLTEARAADYVILSRRGDIAGKCYKVGRLYIHWITDGRVWMKNRRCDLWSVD